jgi:sugar (pentulose or hexulose) kinase
MDKAFFLGLDVGTQGTRAVLIDSGGDVLGHAEEDFPLNENMREEQSPQTWWQASKKVLSKVLEQVNGAVHPSNIKGIAVTSTSGTVIPLDASHQPLHPALMYSDKRSAEVSPRIMKAVDASGYEGYKGFNSSSGLSKMVWFVENFPEKADKIAKWVHAADYITGMLSGIWGLTDYTNALKSGYDVNTGTWPGYLFEGLSLDRAWMPQVHPAGKVIGHIEQALAKDVGLSTATKVVLGMTDGCASQIASGAIKPGDWNTTIGTTMVIKGVTTGQIIDSQNRVYSHRHPQGYWMPGGASNTGADWVTQDFGGKLDQLEQEAMKQVPSGHLSYPLRQKGERFPFISPDATGFEPEGLDLRERFVSNMEGVAYLERYAFELMEQLSGEKVNAVYTAGGGSQNKSWLKIRSNVMGLPIYKKKHTSGAYGAAVLAASQTHFTNLTEAGEGLIQTGEEIFPETALADRYEGYYQEFRELLLQKGYIQKNG